MGTMIGWNRVALLVSLTVASASAITAQPAAWDGLVEVNAKRMDAAYILPGADFSAYTKLLIDPAEVAFHKDWMSNINRATPGLSRDVTDADIARIAETARADFSDVFKEAFAKGGYEIVSEPASGVLRLSPAIVNLYINAPDAMAAGRVRTYTLEAGEATLVLEARDAVTGALLGRALDRRETRRSASLQLTSGVTNLADFKALFRRWADICVTGLGELRAQSPIAAAVPAAPAASTAAPSPDDLFGRSPQQSEDIALRAVGVERIDELIASVTTVTESASGKLVITLDNDQAWSQVDTTSLRLKAGDEVRIRRAMLDSYLLTRADGGKAIRVRRSR